MAISDQELEEFKVEALELLENAEKSLLDLDQGGAYQAAFDTVFRCFHNLKGAAGVMDLSFLQAHIHELESILMQFKTATALPKEHISLFLKGIDASRAILNGNNVKFDFSLGGSSQNSSEKQPVPVVQEVKSVEPPVVENATLVPDSAVDEFILESEEIIDRVSDALQLIESKQHTKETVEALYRDVHSLKGSSYLFSYNKLGAIAHAIESSLEGVRTGEKVASKNHINVLFKCIEAIEKEVNCIKSKGPISATDSETTALILSLESDALGVEPSEPPAQLDSPIPAQLIIPTVRNDSPSEVPPVMKTEETQTSEAVNVVPKDKEAEGNSSIRVSVSLLDSLMTLMGEMVLVRNQVLQFSSNSEDLEFLNLSKRLNVVTSEIQGEMMKTRMQPIGNILSKFSRVVRDLSLELKKEISLNLHGADTELDRSLLEAIKDPLTHIVRNSCDHGIEMPDVRVGSGKQKAGSINIRAYHESGQVVVEVSDDGKGLHKDTLLKKGIEKGLVTPAQAASMTEKEIFNLIFAPGFSTAASITNVSGRGVGMDVVRTNVERIGGSVELSSAPGKGTTTKLKIPLTLAIVPALIVKCGESTYAIPQVKLEELVRVDQSSAENKIEFLHGAPVYRLRGNILPLVSLNKIIGTPASESANTVNNIVVLNADQCAFGLIVDEIQDTADIVVKPINRLLKSLQVYSGATILGDGSISLILDVMGISKVAQIGLESSQKEAASASKRIDATAAGECQEFLLVRLESSTLHAIVLGYVHRLEEFNVSQIEMSGSQRVIRYGTYILPIISISEQLGYKKAGSAAKASKISVVVVQKSGTLYGLEVEEIVDTLSTDADIDTTLVKQNGIFGNINTPQKLIVAIDPFEIIAAAIPESVVAQLPVIKVSKAVDSATPVPQIGGFTKQNILLVEDTIFFRKAVAAVLKKAGHEVTLAVDGKDAFEIIEKANQNFDLIISDIEMPRMNGFEFAKAIRTHQKYAGVPLIALSSRADRKYIDQGMAAGFNTYMEKLKPAVLLETITELTKIQRGVA